MKLQSDKMTLCHATLPPPYPPPPPPPGMFFHLGGGGGGGGGKVAWHSFFHLGGGGGGGGGRGGMAQNHFSDRTLFFDLQFKNTSNLILLSFKMSSESFLFHKFFNTGLTFWNMYLVLKIAKLGPNVFPYRWDTLYISKFGANDKT